MHTYTERVKAVWQGWYEQDYSELRQEIKVSIAKHIEQLRNKNTNERLYGYSLYTCNGFPHFQAVSNTMEQFEALSDVDELGYYQYCPDEWALWEQYACFERVNDFIETLHRKFESMQAAYEDLDPEGEQAIDYEVERYWQDNVERLFNVSLAALTELKAERSFEFLSQDIEPVVLIWFSDASDWEFSMVKQSVETLNSSRCLAEFCLALES